LRMNVGGWWLIAFFMIGGIFFWITEPGIGIGQIWVAVSGFLIIGYLFFAVRSRLNEGSAQTGVRGDAQILEMTQTGMMVNNQPRVKLKLRVSAPGVPAFEDKRTVTVPLIALGQLATGRPLSVFLQPDKPKKYVIDWSGVTDATTAAATSTGGGPFDSFYVRSQTGDGSVASGGDAAQAIMAALKQHGIDPSSGTVDLRNLPGAREAVLAALRDHGIDVAHQVAMASPAIPIPATQEPVERMAKLKQLHDTGLISQAEYEENRKRILGQL
jgi:putative oligomerization/nucleic acid binding protein